MNRFAYHRPKSIGEAASVLSANPEAKLLAGGMTLIPTMKQRLATPTGIVDLNALGGMSGIAIEGNEIVIGAMTRHAEVAASVELASALPALVQLAGVIGDPQVRHRGTLGGSIANSDPAADYPAAVLGLNASIVTDRRTIAADDFFLGMFQTALAPDEIIRQVRFRIPRKAAYVKFANPASRYAVVGVFVAQHSDGVRVAVTGAGPCAFRVTEMEAALNANFAADAIANIHVSANGLNTDPHASAAYRAHLITVMARRAVAGC